LPSILHPIDRAEEALTVQVFPAAPPRCPGAGATRAAVAGGVVWQGRGRGIGSSTPAAAAALGGELETPLRSCITLRDYVSGGRRRFQIRRTQRRGMPNTAVQ